MWVTAVPFLSLNVLYCRCCVSRTWVHRHQWRSWWHCSPGLNQRMGLQFYTACWLGGWRVRPSSRCQVKSSLHLFSNVPLRVYVAVNPAVFKCVCVLLADPETAEKALQLVHGFRLLGKPLVVEFGRERQEEKRQKENEVHDEKKWKKTYLGHDQDKL